MDELVTIVVAIIGSGVLNTLISKLFEIQKSKNNNDKEIRQACRLLMKDRLRFLCVHYINQGWIYEDELEDIVAMHKCYHDDLKGNGFLDSLMARVKDLEIRGVGVK